MTASPTGSPTGNYPNYSGSGSGSGMPTPPTTNVSTPGSTLNQQSSLEATMTPDQLSNATTGSDILVDGFKEPAVDVPSDAFRVTKDMVVSDNMVAVTPDGTVIDGRGDETIIHTHDGRQVHIQADGKVWVDADFRNGVTTDRMELQPGHEFELNGTTVVIDQANHVVMTQPDGTEITVFENGAFEIDLPDGEATPDGTMPADGSLGGDDGNGSDPAPPPGGGGPGGGDPTPPPGGGGPGGGDPTPPGDEDPASGDDPTSGEDGKDGNDGSDGGPSVFDLLEVDIEDLLADAAYYAARSADAGIIANDWAAATGQITHWGLWTSIKAAFEQGCNAFNTQMSDATAQLQVMSDQLTETATAYQDAEQHNEQEAKDIWG